MPLAESTRSGTKPKCSLREVGAGACHAALDLVGDEDDAVGGAPLLQRGEVAVGRHDESALALDGLDDEAGEVGGADRLLEVADRARRGLLAPSSPSWNGYEFGAR